jgi:hypothetical protein
MRRVLYNFDFRMLLNLNQSKQPSVSAHRQPSAGQSSLASAFERKYCAGAAQRQRAQRVYRSIPVGNFNGTDFMNVKPDRPVFTSDADIVSIAPNSPHFSGKQHGRALLPSSSQHNYIIPVKLQQEKSASIFRLKRLWW